MLFKPHQNMWWSFVKIAVNNNIICWWFFAITTNDDKSFTAMSWAGFSLSIFDMTIILPPNNKLWAGLLPCYGQVFYGLESLAAQLVLWPLVQVGYSYAGQLSIQVDRVGNNYFTLLTQYYTSCWFRKNPMYCSWIILKCRKFDLKCRDNNMWHCLMK